VSDASRAQLARAKARLDRLDLYPTPVRIERARLVVAPWFFRLPWFRRYRGYALIRTILVARPAPSDDLVTHELCHLWQLQHRPLRMPLAYVRHRYRSNPYELEAREAVAATRAAPAETVSDTGVGVAPTA
jgi:hypothetical protein